MWDVLTGLLAGLAVATAMGGAKHPCSARIASPNAPAVVVDLAKVGWSPPPYVSDREFFKDFTPRKLESRDENTRIVFLDERVIIVYHTEQEGKDWRTAPRSIEAFFLQARDGSLIATRRWPSSLRRVSDDMLDSEGRLIPIKASRFLVFANGTITLYGPTIELLKQKKLESSVDVWSVQGIDGGNHVFLRHDSTSEGVRYLWLDPDALEVDHEVSGYRGRDYSIGGAVADRESVFERSRAGIRMIDRDQRVKIICDDPLCRETGSFQVLSSHYLGWSGMSGIGLVDIDRGGLIWSKSVLPQYRHKAFEFGRIRSAMSGTKFAVWVVANQKASFDEVEIKSVTILVYDLANLKDRPLVFRLNPVRIDWDFALSPNGTALAVFDGANVQIFPCGRPLQ
jgi:hypothetical protein